MTPAWHTVAGVVGVVAALVLTFVAAAVVLTIVVMARYDN